MSNMKKHSFIHVDFCPSIKLTKAEEVKISKWLEIASLVIEELFKKHKIIHPSWLKDATAIKISVLLCGEAKIKKLNADYRNKDKVTDVLSFPTFESLRKPKTRDDFTGKLLLLGDLAICHQKIIKQAKAFDISYWDEFIHLFLHGTIHLLGFDHEISATEEKIMEKWENLALNIFSKKKKGP